MLFFKKLRSAISQFIGRDTHKWDELEDILIEADFGAEFASKMINRIKYEKDLLTALTSVLRNILTPLITDISVDTTKKPYILTLIGVNGGGKTTTVAKLAFFLKSSGFSVDIAACDTFRAAATEQLSAFAERLNCNIFKSNSPRDPASVAFEALQSSKSDVLIVDTAGRLQNNVNLMNELAKIYRVMKKIDESAPHLTILVIDATVGQNAVDQVREFTKFGQVSGIIVSKMDGGAKGGTIVRIADEFKLPIFGVGVGESVESFERFSVNKFLKDLME
ncbi:MAG: signal recognition particle-docking protein FtsY [Holosporales bacterium]|jgi:fused signal recognition particle receptor|nr:signal recognition particle-docking protein FtsY [Holosporales bacterium]